jgi:cytochrome oxidase Cu insertion factor (SCO1/SenC/PrrC family)
MKSRLLLLMGMVAAGAASAQQPQPATPLSVGVEAPDFTLPSGTKDGVGNPVSLRDFRGQVVVLAFFFRARTPG